MIIKSTVKKTLIANEFPVSLSTPTIRSVLIPRMNYRSLGVRISVPLIVCIRNPVCVPLVVIIRDPACVPLDFGVLRRSRSANHVNIDGKR
jgi:hypothetical protein